jgi:Ca2+-binding EF-hand superfamily protein
MGGLYYQASNGADTLVPASAIDAVCKGKPIGSSQNVKYSRLAVAHKLSLKIKTSKKRLRQLFDTYDADGNGSLDTNEFVEVVTRFCPGEILADDIRDLMRLLDSDGNGVISFEEFTGFVETFSGSNATDRVGTWSRSTTADWHLPITLSTHRDDLAEGDSTANHLTLTRSQQHRMKEAKAAHGTRSNTSIERASSYGGFLAHLQVNSAHTLLDPEAIDAGLKRKAMGQSNSSTLTINSIVTKLQLCMRTRKSELKRIFKRLDRDKNGYLDSNEFAGMMQYFMPGECTKKEARQILRLLDVNRDGKLQWEEILAFVNEHHAKCAVQKAEVLAALPKSRTAF